MEKKKTYKSNWGLGTFNSEFETLQVCWSIGEVVLSSLEEAKEYIRQNKNKFPTNSPYIIITKSYFKTLGHIDARVQEHEINPNYQPYGKLTSIKEAMQLGADN